METTTKNSLRLYDKVMVEVYNYKLKESEWHAGAVTNICASSNPEEDFDRISVIVEDGPYTGTIFSNCHPDCVKGQ